MKILGSWMVLRAGYGIWLYQFLIIAYLFTLAGQKVTSESTTLHLGIKRDVSGKVNVEEKVTLGRKTAYSLMGAGFHSVNGLKTSQNSHIWSIFVVPRIVYGLEVLLPNKKEFECLEKFQRQSVRQIQGLPDKTPNSITLALLGMLPLKIVIHKNVLTCLWILQDFRFRWIWNY